MFEIRTDDPGTLKRITAAGAGIIILGLVLAALNLIAPLVTENGYTAGNVVFGLFGLLAVMLATHSTYNAALKLENS